jgi:hypothetical protein
MAHGWDRSSVAFTTVHRTASSINGGSWPAGAQYLSMSPISPGAAWQTQIGKRTWGSPVFTKIAPIHAFGPSRAVAGRTTRRRSSSTWPSAHVLLARGPGRALGAGTSGVIDNKCRGYCRSSWRDNGPRHFAESRHHELLGRTHGTRLLSWTSRLVGRACAWGSSSQEKVVPCCGRGSDTVPAVPRLF